MQNLMLEFAKNNRTTEHFRDLAVAQIKIAYRIMEYLAPDSVFTPKVNSFTKELMLKEEFAKAYEFIAEEVMCADNYNYDFGSLASEDLQSDAIALMKCLLPVYQKECTDAKEQRRIALIKELKELES